MPLPGACPSRPQSAGRAPPPGSGGSSGQREQVRDPDAVESPIAGELAAFVSRLIPYPPSSTRPSPRSTRPAAVRTNLTEFGTSVARYVWGEVGAGPGIPTGRRPSGRPPQSRPSTRPMSFCPNKITRLEPGQGWAISCGAVAGETLGSSATAGRTPRERGNDNADLDLRERRSTA